MDSLRTERPPHFPTHDGGIHQVTLSIRAAAGPKRVVVQRVTRLVCPREHPWGPSVCINDVRLSKLASNEAFQMEIEMQSGDVLSILGSDISLEP